jgi:hypothetical protein
MGGKGARECRTLLISPKNSTLARRGMRGKSAPGGAGHLLEAAQANALPESDQVIGNVVLLAPELLYVSHPAISSASIYTVGAVNSRLSIRSRTPP